MFLLIRLIINAVALLVAAWLVPGIYLSAARGATQPDDWLTLRHVALLFGALKVVLRTPALFPFVANALMLILTSWIPQRMGLGFRVEGFLPGLLGALIISMVSF